MSRTIVLPFPRPSSVSRLLWPLYPPGRVPSPRLSGVVPVSGLLALPHAPRPDIGSARKALPRMADGMSPCTAESLQPAGGDA